VFHPLPFFCGPAWFPLGVPATALPLCVLRRSSRSLSLLGWSLIPSPITVPARSLCLRERDARRGCAASASPGASRRWHASKPLHASTRVRSCAAATGHRRRRLVGALDRSDREHHRLRLHRRRRLRAAVTVVQVATGLDPAHVRAFWRTCVRPSGGGGFVRAGTHGGPHLLPRL